MPSVLLMLRACTLKTLTSNHGTISLTVADNSHHIINTLVRGKSVGSETPSISSNLCSSLERIRIFD